MVLNMPPTDPDAHSRGVKGLFCVDLASSRPRVAQSQASTKGDLLFIGPITGGPNCAPATDLNRFTVSEEWSIFRPDDESDEAARACDWQRARKLLHGSRR